MWNDGKIRRSLWLWLFLFAFIISAFTFYVTDEIRKVKQTGIQTLGDITISSSPGSESLSLQANLLMSYKPDFLSLTLCDCEFELTIQSKSVSLDPSFKLRSSQLSFSRDTNKSDESCLRFSPASESNSLTVSFLISAGELMTTFGHVLNNNHSSLNLIVTCASVQVFLGVLLLQDNHNVNLAAISVPTSTIIKPLDTYYVFDDQDTKSRRLESNAATTEYSISFNLAEFLTHTLRSSGGTITSTSRILIPSKLFRIEAFLMMEAFNSNRTENQLTQSPYLAKSLVLLDSGGLLYVQASASWSEAASVVSGLIKPVLLRSIVSSVVQHISGVGSNNNPASSIARTLSTSLLSMLGQDEHSIDPVLAASLHVKCDADEGDALCLSFSKNLNPSSCSSTECFFHSHIVIGNADSFKPIAGPSRRLQNIPTHTLTLSPLGFTFDTRGKVSAHVSSTLDVEGSSSSVFLDAAIAKALNIARSSNYTLSGLLSVATTVDLNWFHYNWSNDTAAFVYDNRSSSDVSTSTCGTLNLFIRGEKRVQQTVTVGVNAELDASYLNQCIEHILNEYGINNPSSAERDLFVTSSNSVNNIKLGGLIQLRLDHTDIGVDANKKVIGRLSAPISLNRHLWAISSDVLPQSSFSQNISAGSGSIEASLTLPMAVYQLPQFEHFSSSTGAEIKNQPKYKMTDKCRDVVEINNDRIGAYFHNLAYAGCDDGTGLPSRDAAQGPCLSGYGSRDVLNLLNSIFPNYIQISSSSSSFGRVSLVFKESDTNSWGAIGNDGSLPPFLNYASVSSYSVKGCTSFKSSSNYVSSLPSTPVSSSSLLNKGYAVTIRVDSASSKFSSSLSPFKRSLPPSDFGCNSPGWQAGLQTTCGSELLLRVVRMFSPIVDDFYSTFKDTRVDPVKTVQSSWRYFLRYTWPQLSILDPYISLTGEQYIDGILTGLRKLFISYPVKFVNSLQIESGSVQADVFILDTNNNESVAWVNASTLYGGYVLSGSINSSRISSLDVSCKLIDRAVKPAPIWAKLSGSVNGKNTSVPSEGSPIYASIHIGYLLEWFDLIASRFPIYKLLTGSTEAYLYKDNAVTTIIVKAIDYWSNVATTNTSCYTRNGLIPSSTPRASTTPSTTATPSFSVTPSTSPTSQSTISGSPSPTYVPIPSDGNSNGNVISQSTAIIVSFVAGIVLSVAIGGFVFARYFRGGRLGSRKRAKSSESSSKVEIISDVDASNVDKSINASISTIAISDWQQSRSINSKSGSIPTPIPLPLYSL